MSDEVTEPTRVSGTVERLVRCLDLFCCEGGAGMGYHLAGMEVTGVDIKAQPRYPFAFVQTDAVQFLCEHGHKFDFIHASPPCQAHSSTAKIRGNVHPRLIEPIRELLRASRKPFVIENVPGAPLHNPTVLCGSMFGLRVRRHRLFETSFELPLTLCCNHSLPAVTIIGHGVYPSEIGVRHGGAKSLGYDAGRDAMQVPWISWQGLSQAIPPAYTRWIGETFLRTANTSPEVRR